jgi:PAS domain S-box-containing protein
MQFEQLTEHMEVLIATSDQTSNANYFNKAWEIFTGRSRIELLNYGWADLVHKEDVAGILKIYTDAFAHQKNWKGEFRMRNSEGEYRWLLSTGIKLETDGVFAGYVSSSVDITEQVNARRMVETDKQILRELVLTAPIGICVLNAPSLVAEIVNQSFVEIAGKPYERIMGNYYWDTFAEAAPYYEEALKGVVNKGEPYYANEVPLTLIRHGKSEDIYVTFVYTPIKNSDGEVYKVIVWVLENTRQVTERQRVEDEVAKRTKDLAEANNNLRESNAELAQFAYIASHDLQEPLRKISVYSQMVQKLINVSTHPHEANFLNKIAGSTARMQVLIRDVLAYSELSTKNQSLSQVDLNEVALNSKADFELLIEEQNAILEWISLPTIDGNEQQMSQLFGNMMSNALKFARKDTPLKFRITSTGTATDEIMRHNLSTDRDFVTIHFADNGIGIRPEHTGKIFDIFQRLHRKSEYEGTGIGLAMCKKIALNHQGAIDAEGSNEKGAIFNVILPLKTH